MYDAYRTYLTGSFGPDFWSDVAIDEAASVLAKFSAQDWNRLSVSWSEEAVAWKVRCAQTLDTGLQDQGREILLAMLRDADPDVIVAAADSLRSWPKGVIGLDPVEASRLNDVARQRGGIDEMVLSDLLAKA